MVMIRAGRSRPWIPFVLSAIVLALGAPAVAREPIPTLGQSPGHADTSRSHPIELLVLPDDADRFISTIASARQTIDIVIYEIGGPLIVGQAGMPGALMDAVSRGVKVRVIINGNWAGHGVSCPSSAATSRAQLQACAMSMASWAYAMRESLDWAYRHPKPNVTPRRPEIRAANNNFQVTHQKTILIDATYPDGPHAGDPREPDDLLPTTRAVISTGNLSSEGWGFQGRNTAWLTDPAASCWDGGPGDTQCQPEIHVRDFAAVVATPDLVTEIARIYRSDFWCGAHQGSSRPSRTNTNGLRTTAMPLTWSNGTLQMPPGPRATHYPTAARGYSYPTMGRGQGNVRTRTLDLIGSARSSIRVYNEEMQDPQVVGALIEASRRLGPGKVRVLMTYTPTGPAGQDSYGQSLAQLAAAGVSISLSQYAGPGRTNPEQLYMHAKVFVVDGKDAYLGSTNAGTASMDFNRELGIMLTARPSAKSGAGWAHAPAAITRLVDTFDQDFSNTDNVTPWQTVAAATNQNLTPGPGMPSWPQPPWRGTLPMLCGPLP